MKVRNFLAGGERVHAVPGADIKGTHAELQTLAHRYRKGAWRRFWTTGQTTSVALDSKHSGNEGTAKLTLRVGTAQREITHTVADGVETREQVDSVLPGILHEGGEPRVARVRRSRKSTTTATPGLFARMRGVQSETTHDVVYQHEGTDAAQKFREVWGRHLKRERKGRKSSPRVRNAGASA